MLEVAARVNERVNDPKHPDFDETQRLLGLWLPPACELMQCEMHAFMSEDQTQLELTLASCVQVLSAIYGIVPAPVDRPAAEEVSNEQEQMPSLHPTMISPP